ncbi:MAG TPA: TonB-dependent receptor [Vicinamibacterales bacterium]|nr:TonB-dependent receptor [Vicinamibacterales bacterium]
MRCLLLCGLVALVPGVAAAQSSIAGEVKDTSGAVLPGVTVEASSPALIEKSRTAVTDNAGRYRIEALQPGSYTVTFTLAGFATVKRENLAVSGSGVITVDADMKVGGVQETVTVTGEAPVVDVTSTKAEVTLDNETVRSLPSVRSYSYLLNTVPGVQTNNNNVNTGPVFAIFPVHGGRGVESRVTVDGLNVSNPPGGNQPPDFAADIGNAQEVTMTTAGGLGEAETAGLTMNIVPKQGGNKLEGLFAVSGFSKGMQSDNFTDELKARGATQPTPVYHVYDVNGAVGGPIIKDKLWYYMSVREQGQRQDTQNVYYNKNVGDATTFVYAPDLTKPAFSDRTWENYTPRITWQVNDKNKITGSWDEEPTCRKCSGTTSLTGTPNFVFPTAPEADGRGEYSPKSIQELRWTSPMTSRLLLEAGYGSTYYQWGGNEVTSNPNDLIQALNLTQTIAPGVVTPMRYRSQAWNVDKTRGSTWNASVSYITGSHSAKFGYQGNYWRDDRSMYVNSQSLGYIGISLPGVPFFPISLQEYINPQVINARAMAASFYAQDQWTINRLTLQGALRYDRPWSWFPATTVPASRFFPGISFSRTDGVTGYNDITPRMGAVYDLFGNGKTALKVSLGKYLQGASVSNLGYGANPATQLATGSGLSTAGLCSFGNVGFTAGCVSRSWFDANFNLTPNCDLTNPLANGECGQIDNLAFGTTALTSHYDPSSLSGWGIRPSDWSLGLSVQQQLFARASVEVGYYRRTLTQFGTSGTVTDNLAISPSDVGTYYLTAPTDSRLPGGGGYQIGPLYDVNPSVFGKVNNLVESTTKVGDDTRVFNGVDITVNVRNAKGVTFSGGTSTSKVTNNTCALRAAIPEAYLLNPYCNPSSPWQTSLRGLVTYTIPHVDVLLSSVFQDKPNIGTDQIGSLSATYTLSAADIAAAAAQLGRPLTATAPQVNLLAPGQVYGPRIREIDLSVKKILRFGAERLTVGLDMYNLANNNVTLGFNSTFVPGTAGWQSPTSYMNPRVFRLAAELAF